MVDAFSIFDWRALLQPVASTTEVAVILRNSRA
jgi:hypothetical protein